MLGNLWPVGAWVYWDHHCSHEWGIVVAARVGRKMYSLEPTNQYRIEQECQSKCWILPWWVDEADLTWQKESGLFEWSKELGRHVPRELAKA